MTHESVERARAQVLKGMRGAIVLSVVMFSIFYWGVVPWFVQSPRCGMIAVVLGAFVSVCWVKRWADRWERHLAWCVRRAMAEGRGDTITLLGLAASPDADRPKMWPAFYWRWWGLEL
jgi:hypothetical protein